MRRLLGDDANEGTDFTRPKATLASIRRTRLALKGPLETPSGGGYSGRV